MLRLSLLILLALVTVSPLGMLAGLDFLLAHSRPETRQAFYSSARAGKLVAAVRCLVPNRGGTPRPSGLGASRQAVSSGKRQHQGAPAGTRRHSHPLRLRWCLEAREDIEPGRQITGDLLVGRLRPVPGDVSIIPTVQLARARYARVPIPAGTALKPSSLSRYAPGDSQIGGAVVPLEVKTEHTVGLQPGMPLAFVQNRVLLPRTNSLSATKYPFKLLSVTTSPRDAALTILSVKVPGERKECIPALATGQWRPIILGRQRRPSS